jgi:O-6-methylguanine DNA methyltransferase
MKTIYYTHYPWELTDLFLAATKDGLVRISFAGYEDMDHFKKSLDKKYKVVRDDGPFFSILQNLTDYFSGKPVLFEKNLDILDGTKFQNKVWQKVSEIAYGQLKTYKQIAIELGNAKSVRAVGTANGANPIPIVIPCHRVVQSNGGLGGYSGGLEIKDALLRLEGAVF